MKTTLSILTLSTLLLCGCATVEPNAIRIEGQHVSHLLQHFDGSGDRYGAEMVGVDAHWQWNRWYLDLAEYYSPSAQIDRRREEFNGRVGYEIRLK